MAEDDSILGRSVEDFFSNLVDEPVVEKPRRRRLVVIAALVVLASGGCLCLHFQNEKPVFVPEPALPDAVVLTVTPERLVASAALGYVSFLVGIPWVAGLSDNAVLGVVATLATLFSSN